MPELAAVYVIGSILALIASIAFALSSLAFYKRRDVVQLQANLAKFQLYWNEITGQVEDLTDDSLLRELEMARFSYFVMGFASVLFSWLGFFFTLVIWISLRKLVKRPLGDRLLASRLASETLGKSEVAALYIGLKS